MAFANFLPPTNSIIILPHDALRGTIHKIVSYPPQYESMANTKSTLYDGLDFIIPSGTNVVNISVTGEELLCSVVMWHVRAQWYASIGSYISLMTSRDLLNIENSLIKLIHDEKVRRSQYEKSIEYIEGLVTMYSGNVNCDHIKSMISVQKLCNDFLRFNCDLEGDKKLINH
jgi:hypothetical protein